MSFLFGKKKQARNAPRNENAAGTGQGQAAGEGPVPSEAFGKAPEPAARNVLRTDEEPADFSSPLLAAQGSPGGSPVNAPADAGQAAQAAAASAVSGDEGRGEQDAARPQAQDAAQAGRPGRSILDADADESGSIDWWLFVLMVMLLGIGLVMVLSASGIVAESSYGDKYYYFKKQLVFAGIGGVGLCCAALLPRRLLYRLHYPLLFVVLFLLLLTLSPLSPSINGAHRWIRVGPVNIQPMEFVKIALALYLAYYMSEKQELVKTFTRGVLPPFGVTLLFCCLLLLQPDFGSAVVLALILFFMCLAGGTRFLYLILAFIMTIVLGVLLAIFEPYRMRRLMAFLDPFEDAHNTGYQLVQSLLAIGSGSFFGVGMGASRQKMFYLPEAHNDFIMAVLAEEMGFVGVSVVMLLFLFFFYRCYLIIRGQDDLRARYTAFALTCIICLGFLLNLAVVMGVAPPKGVPMPFLSYGGSNLVATMISVGLLLNFSRTAKMPH